MFVSTSLQEFVGDICFTASSVGGKNSHVERGVLMSFVVQSLNFVCLFMTPCTAAHQAPLSIGFLGEEYQSILPIPPPGDLPDPGIEPMFFQAKIRTRARVHPWDSSKKDHNPRITAAKKDVTYEEGERGFLLCFHIKILKKKNEIHTGETSFAA